MNIERFTKALSEILSEKHGVNITIKAERRTDESRHIQHGEEIQHNLR